MRNWAPDVAIDPAIAHDLVAAEFPDFTNQQPSLLGRGWDNLCIEYPDATVFRFPTRRMGAELAEIEIPTLSALSPYLPLPIPIPTHVGTPSETYPYRFFGYQKILGNPIENAVAKAAESLGEFLAALHAIDPSRPPFSNLPGDTLKRADRLMEKIELRGGQIIDHFPDQADWARRLMHRAETELLDHRPSNEARVVHGDLYARHILADGSGTVTGIIDWGDVHRGNPAIDLSIGFSVFRGSERAVFTRTYGHATLQWGLARARALMYALAMVAYGSDIGDPAAIRLGHHIADNAMAG
ncbi:MAG: hypothetical protein HONBIEJF_00766 [Fimbriimonadaceae bacterium]|nr:hypothetical protein [Fimbriimonadaceae bacterium]